jgi:GNAT superfamily N-acetyltransferase
MIALRFATPAEIPLLREIERASAQRFIGLMDALAADEPSPPEILAARIASDGLLVAADAADAPIAFVMFRPVEDGLYIEQIDVLPAFAGRRVGAALLDAVADQARSGGLKRLMLSTFRDVPWNAPYYGRLGFADIADDALTPGLIEIRREHLARGLDESQRTFMGRKT